MNKLESMFKIADIHALRISKALQGLSHIFPLSVATMQNLSELEFLLIELLVSRFAKLQDFMGTKLIDVFLESKDELLYNMTMIDKLNKLERLEIIVDTNSWRNMRDVRNHLAHEYPEQPEITVQYLNQLFSLASELLSLLDKMKK